MSNSLRVKHHEALRELILTVFREQRAAEIIHRLDRAQIANTELRDVDAFLEHPQLWERNRVRKVNSPAGEINALLPRVIPRGIQPVMNPIPEVGEHSEAILRELGFPSASIQRWSIESVIG
ncbi:CoA transferase [Kroppenstedtia eburnea]|uniref:CoA transferase n=1 Tax=Kroppenstedtia eburnea TaxID=714067 RepID=UPI0022860423|nr:CoA transferase [Kroppenstedtia eburnea]